jgi:hypothetical protein
MKKLDLILEGTELHPGRMKLINSWADAKRHHDRKAARVYAEIIEGIDDLRGIERTRQLMFSGAAFVSGFLVALIGYLN